MKRRVLLCLTVLLLFACVFPVSAAAEVIRPSRQINVVYDDSGSMYEGGVDTWCHAKYSMEVFAALMGETDVLNIYYMSDCFSNLYAAPRITLYGKDGAGSNVPVVHNETTNFSQGTPFSSVTRAYDDLDAASADEKWLVILTDGEFGEFGQRTQTEVDNYLSKKSPDIDVVYLKMGSKAKGITNKPEQGIYYVEAKTSRDILNCISGICSRIFNYNRLELDVSSKSFSFDIPMSELIVFAQGTGVSLGDVQKEGGSSYKSSTEPVQVKYSECDAVGLGNRPVEDLVGLVADFKGDFNAGTYSVDASGAETIEVYYQPNIEIAAHLTDSEGKSVANLSEVVAGDYTISFDFVKAGTTDFIPDSPLLGDVAYEATVTNNGLTHDRVYSNGDKISLEEGTLHIDATGRYLEYNRVITSLDYDVFKDKTISFSVPAGPSFTVDSDGISQDGLLKIEAKIDGHEFTPEQWADAGTPTIELVDNGGGYKLEMSPLEKTEQPGVYTTRPVLPDGKPSAGTYADTQFTLSFQQQLGSETWKGSGEGTVKMQDARPWWERNWDKVVKYTIMGLAFLFLTGYLPLFKCYLPRGLKKNPNIVCIPSEPGETRKDKNGNVEKSLLSTIVPYVPQRGRIRYAPKGVPGFPVMEVKAVRGRRMRLTNIKTFMSKDYIRFDGEPITKDTKKFVTSSGVEIRATRGEWTYECSPSQSKF